MKKNIYFLFNFYGAGNIGDDLMLAGYLVLFGDKYNIDAFTPYNVASQRLRFPEINWLKKRPANFKTYDKIIGMGDTPFQITAGAWLIRYINKHIKKIKLEGRCFEMQFVGAEKEVINANWFHRRKIKNIINSTSKILTRDSHSKNIIESFEAKSDIVNAGDIANAYLSRYGTNQDKNELKSIAINYFTYKSDRRIISLLQRFIKNHPDIKFTFFANETRKSPPFEKYTFTKYFSIYENVSFLLPDYNQSSMEELIGHFNEYDLVLSSRFHALLTAAWFRCRVIALSLSSKISQLAEELDVEMIEPDFDNALFEKKVHSSRVVDIERLNKILKRLMDVSVTC